jgi:ferredoxin--NADP+ reductase
MGATVVLFNRDVKPGGLAEYGIFPTKHKMKEGLRRQFRSILSHEKIIYLGNLTVGQSADLTLDDLRSWGFQAVLVTVGAQGTKWLGLPGEDLEGVYHAKDIVYHYNHLPPFSQQQYVIGEKVALIGVGNVMVDIAHWAVRMLKVDEVIAVARRGPAEVKFTRKEFAHIAANLDVEALEAELQRVAERMEAVGQDVGKARDFILSALSQADPKVSDTRFRFAFLSSPVEIIGERKVEALKVEDTKLVLRNGGTKAERLGTFRRLEVNTVIFCIGDKVDANFGLPIEWNEFVKNPQPRYPVEGISYEVFDPEKQQPIEGVFVAGWARKASSGLVGVARKDGTRGAQAVWKYLQTLEPMEVVPMEDVIQRVKGLGRSVVTWEDIQKLEQVEQQEAERQGLEEFKFDSNQEMLAAMGLV